MTSPAWLNTITEGAVKQQIDLSPRSARLSRSFTVRGRWLIQTLSSLSTKMPPICPKIQLFGSGLGQLASISNFGACCATTAVPMNANAAAPASAAVPSVPVNLMNSSSLWRGVSFVRPPHRPMQARESLGSIIVGYLEECLELVAE